MPRFAAIDCGTNSLRLLVSDVHWAGSELVITEVHRLNEIVRLGEGVDATGVIGQPALDRVARTLQGYVDIMVEEEVRAVRMVATSATRDAANREEFFGLTAELLGRHWPGAQAEVISGEEEAELSFRGAVADLPADEGPFCVVDLGGGSTEFIVGTGQGRIAGEWSTRMGCVRLTERVLHGDPPTADEIAAAREIIATEIQLVRDHVPVAQARTVVGCAGTFTTLSALAQGPETYDPAAIHLSRLRADALRALCAQVLAMSRTMRAAEPVVHPGRADVLGGGVLVVEVVLDLVAAEAGITEVVISEKDLLDGIVAGLVEEQLPR